MVKIVMRGFKKINKTERSKRRIIILILVWTINSVTEHVNQCAGMYIN